MSKSKGDGYDPLDIVRQAMEKGGWSSAQFCEYAARFGSGCRCDVSVEAQKLEALFQLQVDLSASRSPEHTIWRPAITFAEWILVADATRIKLRLSQYN